MSSLSTLLHTLAKVPRYRDGCCVRLARVVERSRRTLENLQSGKHVRAAAMEMRYEMRVQRAMSDDGMVERADSEADCYSDDGRQIPSPGFARMPGPGSSVDSAEYASDGGLWEGSPDPARQRALLESRCPPLPRYSGPPSAPKEPVWLIPD